MQAVNLLPEYAQPGRRWTATGADLSARRILPLGGVAAVVAAVAFAGLYFNERSVVSDRKSQLATDQARLVAQEARAAPIKAAQTASAARLSMIRTITATRVHWDAVLADLGRVMPNGVHLSSLSVTTISTAGASSVQIAGETDTHNRVALVMDRLSILPWLSGVTLASSARSGDTVSFTLNANYVPEAGS